MFSLEIVIFLVAALMAAGLEQYLHCANLFGIVYHPVKTKYNMEMNLYLDLVCKI